MLHEEQHLLRGFQYQFIIVATQGELVALLRRAQNHLSNLSTAGQHLQHTCPRERCLFALRPPAGLGQKCSVAPFFAGIHPGFLAPSARFDRGSDQRSYLRWPCRMGETKSAHHFSLPLMVERTPAREMFPPDNRFIHSHTTSRQMSENHAGSDCPRFTLLVGLAQPWSAALSCQHYREAMLRFLRCWWT